MRKFVVALALVAMSGSAAKAGVEDLSDSQIFAVIGNLWLQVAADEVGKASVPFNTNDNMLNLDKPGAQFGYSATSTNAETAVYHDGIVTLAVWTRATYKFMTGAGVGVGASFMATDKGALDMASKTLLESYADFRALGSDEPTEQPSGGAGTPKTLKLQVLDVNAATSLPPEIRTPCTSASNAMLFAALYYQAAGTFAGSVKAGK